MRSFPADDGVHAVCPHCYEDDLYQTATRCPHCGGSFGWSAFRRNAILIVVGPPVAAFLVQLVVVLIDSM